MKIRLTEEQYKRLLSEETNEELMIDSEYNSIGTKISKFIADLYVHVNEVEKITPEMMENHYGYDPLKKVIMEIGDYNYKVARVLDHNYIKNYDLIKNNDKEGLIGIPYEFYSEFSINIPIKMKGVLYGYGDGKIQAMATSPEEFYEKIEQGDYDIIEDGYDPTYDSTEIYWEEDHVATTDNIHYNIEELIDKEEIMWS